MASIMLLTIPHSGLRAIRGAVADHVAVTCKISESSEGKKDILYWGHFSENQYMRLVNLARKCRVMSTLRDPLATLCTHVQTGWSQRPWPNSGALHRSYALQMKWAREQNSTYFPIERTSIEEFEDWMGWPLHDPLQSHSIGDYPLKQAIADRDVQELARILGKDWDFFKKYITPTIADFYTTHGYDLWWTNG